MLLPCSSLLAFVKQVSVNTDMGTCVCVCVLMTASSMAQVAPERLWISSKSCSGSFDAAYSLRVVHWLDQTACPTE